MAYNRGYNVGGGGYPPVVPNPGGMYNQPMPPSHQHPQQYGQPFNRNAGVWNMPPGPHIPPQGQQMSPWINNNIPTSFRGYGNVHDNRNQNMNMGLKPNLRMGQGNKRPMDWNNSPNKRNRIGGNINNNNQQLNQNQNQKNKPNNNLNPTNSNTPQQKKPWVPYNKNNRPNNNNNNNNFNNNKRRNQNNREVKLNDKDKNQTNQKKEFPVENIKLDSNSEQSILDSTQEKYFKEASGLICNLCDVFLKDKASAAEHSKLETHQTKFNEAKELEEKEKAAAEAAAAAAAAAAAETETETPTESTSDAKEVTATDNENVSKPEVAENSEASDATEQNGSAVEPLPVVEKETAEGDINAETLAEVPSATATPTEGDNATIPESVEETTPAAEAVDTGDAESPQRGGGRGGRGNRGRGGRGRNRGRGRR